jgi:hypothetical protein
MLLQVQNRTGEFDAEIPSEVRFKSCRGNCRSVMPYLFELWRHYDILVWLLSTFQMISYNTQNQLCNFQYIFQICKVLLQGQSSLVDQLHQGQACVSNVLGNVETKKRFKGLSLHLLFQDSTVVQVVPSSLGSTVEGSAYQVPVCKFRVA